MAIYHFSATVIGRSAGRSAVASAAYRSAEKLTNEREDITHDYTKKGGVISTHILAPENSPNWVYDRNQLWNKVEAVERRKDAQLARDITVALPAELDALEREQLIIEFVKENFVSKGMIADVAMHMPDKGGDNRNYHTHIMLTTRDITPDGFDKKNRSWNDKALLQEWRDNWEKSINNYLERKNIDERVSAKSLIDQGIDRIPTKHIGVTATQMERKGIKTERGNLHRAILDYNHNLELEKAEIIRVEKELAELLEEEQKQQINYDNTIEVYEYLETAEQVIEIETKIKRVPLITAEQIINNDREIKTLNEELTKTERDVNYYRAQASIAKAKYDEQDRKFFGGKKSIKEMAKSEYNHNYKGWKKSTDEADQLRTGIKQRTQHIVNTLADVKQKMVETLKERLKPLYERLERFGGRSAMDDTLNGIKERTGLTELSNSQRWELAQHRATEERQKNQTHEQKQSRGLSR